MYNIYLTSDVGSYVFPNLTIDPPDFNPYMEYIAWSTIASAALLLLKFFPFTVIASPMEMFLWMPMLWQNHRNAIIPITHLFTIKQMLNIDQCMLQPDAEETPAFRWLTLKVAKEMFFFNFLFLYSCIGIYDAYIKGVAK